MAVALGLVCCPTASVAQRAGAADAPLSRLDAPNLRVAEPFTEVVAVGELSDGRAVVADRGGKTFYLISANGARIDPLGRNGSGPNEYVSAFGVVRMPGDSLALYGGNQRLLIVRHDGSFGQSIDVGPAVVGGGGLAMPRGVDASAAFYWAGDLVERAPSGFKRSLRLNVRRWRPGTTHVDTVATVADHAEAMHDRRFHPYAQRDAWVVAPDGNIGVLSASEYRLRWFHHGRMVREGPSIAFAPVRITAEDRAAFRADRVAQPRAGVRVADPSGQARPPGEAARRSLEVAYPDAMFPSHKPPFVEDGLFRSPSGDLWVVRSMPARAPQTRVDVLSASGERRTMVDLPAGRRLVGLERGGIWLIRVDADGLQWLERYPWPRFAPR